MTEGIKGWVFYDGECAFCRRWVDRGYGTLVRHGFHMVSLQAPWARSRLGMKEGEPLTEMRMLTADGHIYGGADVVVQVARRIWWAWPFYIFAQLPGIKPAMRTIYWRIAANRHCLAGKCPVASHEPAKHHHGTRSFYELP